MVRHSVLSDTGTSKEAKMFLEDNERSGRSITNLPHPYPGSVDKTHQLVHEDRRRTSNDIADDFGLTYGFVLAIPIEHVACLCKVRSLSHLLSTEQRENSVEGYQNLCQRVSDDPSRIITGP